MQRNAGFQEEEFLHLAAAAEASSEHPLGKAVTAHARLALRPAQGEPFLRGQQLQQSAHVCPLSMCASESLTQAWGCFRLSGPDRPLLNHRQQRSVRR